MLTTIAPHAGSGLGSDSGAGPTIGAATGLGQGAGADRAPASGTHTGQRSKAFATGPSTGTQESTPFYHSGERSNAPAATSNALTQSARGTATGAGFDSTYRSTDPVSSLMPHSLFELMLYHCLCISPPVKSSEHLNSKSREQHMPQSCGSVELPTLCSNVEPCQSVWRNC